MTGKYGPGRHDDYELWTMILIPVLIGASILWLWACWPQVAQWLADHDVLTRTDVLIPLGAGTGLDIARIAVLAAVLIVVPILVGAALRLVFRAPDTETTRR